MENRYLETMYPGVDREEEPQTPPLQNTNPFLSANISWEDQKLATRFSKCRFVPVNIDQDLTSPLPVITSEADKEVLDQPIVEISSASLEITVKEIPQEQKEIQQSLHAIIDMVSEDDTVVRLKTMSMHKIKIKRVEKKLQTFLINTVILLASILFLGILVGLIIIVPGFIYKVEIMIVCIIAISYVISMHMKRIDQGKMKNYLSLTQLLPNKEKKAISQDDDMEHFHVIKQDTTSYLRRITTRDLQKGSRS